MRLSNDECWSRVRAADHIQIVNLTTLFAESKTLGKKEKVELRPLGGPSQLHKRRKLYVASRFGITPHRGVVDPWKVGGQMNVRTWFDHVVAYRLAGR